MDVYVCRVIVTPSLLDLEHTPITCTRYVSGRVQCTAELGADHTFPSCCYFELLRITAAYTEYILLLFLLPSDNVCIVHDLIRHDKWNILQYPCILPHLVRGAILQQYCMVAGRISLINRNPAHHLRIMPELRFPIGYGGSRLTCTLSGGIYYILLYRQIQIDIDISTYRVASHIIVTFDVKDAGSNLASCVM